jgi:hypothetical protein
MVDRYARSSLLLGDGQNLSIAHRFHAASTPL